MNRYDNPFLTLEFRQHRGERWEAAFNSLLTAVLFVLILPLLPVAVQVYDWQTSRGASPVTPPHVYWLLVPHTLVCVIAGLYAIDRVFSIELRRGIFIQLLLLPFSGSRWLWLKLTYPLLWLLLVWGAAYPLWVIAAVVEVAPFSHLQVLFLVPLAAALLAMSATLLFAPNSRLLLENTPNPGDGKNPSREEQSRTNVLFPALFCFLFLILRLTTANQARLFELRVPTLVLLIVASLAVGTAGWSTARAAAANCYAAEAQALWVRRCAHLIITAILLGIFWGMLPRWVRWVALLGGACWIIGPWVSQAKLDPETWKAWVQERVGRRRPAVFPGFREEGQRELAWVEERWNNPLTLRDLRAALGQSSLRSNLLASLWSIVWSLVLFGGWAWFRLGSAGGPGGRTGASFLLAYIGLTAVFSLRGTVFAHLKGVWNREFQKNTWEDLFLTPLSSREIMRGRLFAGVLASGGALASNLIQVGMALVIAGVVGAWHVPPAIVAAVFGGLPLGMQGLADRFGAYTAGLQGVAFRGMSYATGWGVPLAILFYRSLGLLTAWLLAGITVAVSCFLSRWWFNRAVVELRRARRPQ